MEKSPNNKVKLVNVSLIGVGGYGTKLANIISKVPLLKIISCYHPDNEKTRQAARRIGCEPAQNEHDAVFNNDIDAIIIATPDPFHLRYIRMAMDGGRHIYVEKPVVASLDEALILRSWIETYKGTFFVGHNMRRESGIRYLKNEFDKGTLGKLVTFNISLSHGGAFNWDDTYWRLRPEFCREGPLRVNGVHASDVLEYLFGPVEAVYAKISYNIRSHETPDSGIALIKICDTYGTVNTHWVVPSMNQFHFEFTDAIVDYDLKRLTIRYGRDINCNPTPTKEIKLLETESRLEQMEEFASAITDGNPVETGWDEGFRGVLFFEACYRSYKENRQVKLEELIV